ncbi:MAG: biotin/lipoyl-containing protein, partial [Pseudomonadota bacterium]
MATDVEVPALGESITEGTLAQWLKKPGEAVAADEPIASLETDKVSVEVPSPVAGVLTEQLVQEGDNVAVGSVIARIEAGAAAAAPSAPAEAAAKATTNPAGAGETPALKTDELAPSAAEDDDQITTLSPAVRRAVLEYHVDPTRIKGSGKDGRLTKDDVIAAAEAQKSAPAQAAAQAPQAKAPAPEAKAPPPGPRPSPGSAGERKEERVKMSRLRQTIAKRLKEAQNTAAMLTTFNDVDMSAVIDARARYKDLFEKKHGI